MTDWYRGRVVILNITTADDPREGSRTDCLNLSTMFRKLGFVIADTVEPRTGWTEEVD